MGLGAHLVDRQGLDPQVGQQLHGLIVGHALRPAGFIVGIDVLVEAPVGQAVAVGFDLQHHLDQPDRLHGLVESFGRLIRHLVADAGQLQQLLTAGGGGGPGQLAGQLGIAVREGPHGLQHDQHSLVEHVPVDAAGLAQVQLAFELPDPLLIALQAHAQHLGVVHRQVGVAGVQLALHAEQAGLHVHGHLVRHDGPTPGPQAVVLPEGGDGAQGFLGLFGNVEHVAVPLLEQVQLVDDEAHRVLREHGGVPVGGGLVARQQALVLDVDGHLLQDVLQHQRPAHHRRLVAVGLIDLGTQQGALGVHIGLLLQYGFTVSVHALRQAAEAGLVHHIQNLPTGLCSHGKDYSRSRHTCQYYLSFVSPLSYLQTSPAVL